MPSASAHVRINYFNCVFVRTEMNLIAFSGPRNCVNTQYAALSGAMVLTVKSFCQYMGCSYEFDWLNIILTVI